MKICRNFKDKKFYRKIFSKSFKSCTRMIYLFKFMYRHEFMYRREFMYRHEFNVRTINIIVDDEIACGHFHHV